MFFFNFSNRRIASTEEEENDHYYLLNFTTSPVKHYVPTPETPTTCCDRTTYVPSTQTETESATDHSRDLRFTSTDK
ncbi:hypothetical protein FRX31_018084 [Thalictrum thalictroides]|uniref:Uncharacterized protein n=1 Tax=Thalictrum thalictroides TaxID=46969 RepID=A0A7J6W4M9_THATH|nr:hypothetical protein FRX31_018084 [Thalictrum thalictroides]